MAEPVAERLSFPTDPTAFDADERISFSKLDNKFVAVQADGTEFEFDSQLRRWVPLLDDDLVREHQAAYVPAGYVDTPEEADNGSQRRNKKKRKNGPGEQEAPQTDSTNKKARGGPREPKANTAVYVTGLPEDATVDEVHELFSRKCGVVAEEIDSGRPRIKLYADEDGRPRGDALVVFFKPQSVDMAIMLLDDTVFRFSASGLSQGRIRVQAADSSYKKTHYVDAADSNGAGSAGAGKNGAGNGSNNGGQQQTSVVRSEKDKQKIIKKTQKLSAKLADWSDDESGGGGVLPAAAGSAAHSKKEARLAKTVVLKHMFTLEELAEDPAALLEIKEDVRDECAKIGPVTNVVLYDLEADGVVAVRFRDVDDARRCVGLMHGRSFGGQTVEAAVATGKEKFRKSSRKEGVEDEDDGSD